MVSCLVPDVHCPLRLLSRHILSTGFFPFPLVAGIVIACITLQSHCHLLGSELVYLLHVGIFHWSLINSREQMSEIEIWSISGHFWGMKAWEGFVDKCLDFIVTRVHKFIFITTKVIKSTLAVLALENINNCRHPNVSQQVTRNGLEKYGCHKLFTECQEMAADVRS